MDSTSTLTHLPHPREMSWSDNHSMSSDEGSQDAIALPSPSPSQPVWMEASPALQLQSGQLSPMSAGMDITMETPVDGSSAPTMIHSASSSTDSWSTGFVDRDDADNEVHWEQGSDDVLTIPKLEPLEDDFDMGDLKAAPLASVPELDGVAAQVKPKRPRGRPRKHPLTPAVAASKITKGRSKTGCITCR